MSNPQQQQQKKIERVEITLAYPHEHADVLHPAGAKLAVWPDQAERIRAAEQARKEAEAAAQA